MTSLAGRHFLYAEQYNIAILIEILNEAVI